jgi:hypothetical protein
MRVAQLLTLAQPLMVGSADGPAVVLAFAITTDGELVAMCVGPEGGEVAFADIFTLTFPSPIRLGPVASGTETLTAESRADRRWRKAHPGGDA